MKQLFARSKRTPIYRDTSYLFEGIDEAGQTFDREIAYPQSSPHFIYSRYGTPNVYETEEGIRTIEGSQWAVLTSSGMSAIDLALSICQKGKKTGPWMFFSELYGGTNNFIDNVLVGRRGIDVVRFTPEREGERYDTDKLAEALDRVKPELLYLETVSNPLLIVLDGEKIIRAAKERGITVIVDNTFATALLWKPLAVGADMVIHSATKYLAGHGNVTAGVVCGNDDNLKKEALIHRKYVGYILSVDDAYRLGTQMETFEMRFMKQCDNAMRLARRLEAHYRIESVRYPGLESHTTHKEARQMFGGKGYGAMINFDIAGGREACDRFVKNIQPQIAYTPTLGDSESILLHVAATFGQDKYPFPGMIRFSVGFEPYEKLEHCVVKALDEL